MVGTLRRIRDMVNPSAASARANQDAIGAHEGEG